MSSLADFGRYLSQQRELRGLTRDDVARSTRISSSLIAALEDGEAQRLPERVFVQNYVRAFAAVVGLEPDDALNRLREVPGLSPDPGPTPQMLERRRRIRAAVWAAIWAVGAGAAFAVLFRLIGRT